MKDGDLALDTTSSDSPNMVYLLARAFRWFEEGLRQDADFAHLPQLSNTQLMTLASLDKDGTSISELARRVGVTRQAMHQLVGELSKAALLETVASPTDKRVRLVKLTLLGRTMDEKAVAIIDSLEALLKDRIGVDHASALRTACALDWGSPKE